MEARHETVFTLKCPKCSQELPQALKREEMLETLEVNCPIESCKWKGLAKTAEVKKQSLEEWMGPQYQSSATITEEEFWKMYKEDKEKGRVDLDEHFKNK